MATVFDVAAYFLEKAGKMTAMKLQKLCYYAQAWSLVWDAKPLFADRIEAWANGPVCPALYDLHRGQFEVESATLRGKGDGSAFDNDQLETLDAVFVGYGDKSSYWLSELTHAEDPWAHARKHLKPGERGSTEITHAAMAEYYGSL